MHQAFDLWAPRSFENRWVSRRTTIPRIDQFIYMDKQSESRILYTHAGRTVNGWAGEFRLQERQSSALNRKRSRARVRLSRASSAYTAAARLRSITGLRPSRAAVTRSAPRTTARASRGMCSGP
jgi:hypothetical protein